jgi:acyl-CoA ligase (AMP-forming) (exosortase A-associated)
MTLLHELADASAHRHAARPALRHRGRELTHAQLAARSISIAAGLSAQGVGRGDRVVVYLQNRVEVVEIALACSRLGALFVPANPLLKSRQLRHILVDSAAAVLVFAAASCATVAEALSAHRPKLLVACDGDTGASIGHAHAYEALAEVGDRFERESVIDRDVYAILYTSGSTGPPKGVVVTHRNVCSGASVVAGYLRNLPEDRLLAALPLSFDYGFSQVTTALAVGACAVLTNYSTAPALVQEAAAESITGLAGVPTMWAHLAETEWPKSSVRSLRYVTNSGGALTPALLKRLQARLPHALIYAMYGLTEAFRSTYLDPAELASRPGSIGRAVPNQEILVLRPDGTQCAPGEPGELVHRGSFVSRGYWNEPERTRARFRVLPGANPGLLDEIAVWSGDIVRADEQGYLYFLGRNDQAIKTSGHRVSTSEIEEVLAEVRGIIEAVAVGLPDELLGQRIVVAFVTNGMAGAGVADALRQHARMSLPPYMVPAQFVALDAIPRNANGKPDRAALCALLGGAATGPAT